MIFIWIRSFRVDLQLLSDIVVYWPLQNVFHSFEFKRQCIYDSCNYLLNGTFTFGLSCFLNQNMISIEVFHGDCKRYSPRIVCISLPYKFIHPILDFVLCMQCFMHINQKYVLKIHTCHFIFKEFTNNPALILLFSTVWWPPLMFIVSLFSLFW
jgi:hypothetical protein